MDHAADEERDDPLERPGDFYDSVDHQSQESEAHTSKDDQYDPL